MLKFEELELDSKGELVEVMRVTGSDIVMVDYPVQGVKLLVETAGSCEESESTDGFDVKIVDGQGDIWFVKGKVKANDKTEST
jgi:hypothetical protein|nr:MAG TPA: hypothetical protein [Caudoviricetes sp.]